MQASSFHELVDIITPCCLAALFVVTLLIKNSQEKNQNDLLKNQIVVDKQFRDANDDLKQRLGFVSETINTHVAEDRIRFANLEAALRDLNKD